MNAAVNIAPRADTGGPETGRPLALVGAPCDAGAGLRGTSLGPDALRIAGLVRRLHGLGHRVRDGGNLSGPGNPEGAAIDGYRHLDEVAAWTRTIRDAVHGALAADECPIVLGGDHSVAIGSIMAVARHCADREMPLSILWLDAHADFNTAATTPSGNLHGMPVATLCGDGPAELLSLGHARPVLDPAHVFQVGVRSVDTVERRTVLESGVTIHDMRSIDELGMRAVMQRVLERIERIGGHLHVSFDLDFVDPGIAPGVGTPVPGGPDYREAQLCMEMIHDSGLPGSLDVVEVNPALDEQNRTARLAVELVASLFGERILARVAEQ